MVIREGNTFLFDDDLRDHDFVSGINVRTSAAGGVEITWEVDNEHDDGSTKFIMELTKQDIELINRLKL